jgi:FKBP-type peptidyl-prolyl cis-trans isomerase 2
MKTITVIVNGIELPCHLIDHAILKTKQDAAEVNVLFLKGTQEPKAGYGFPSDLQLAENITSAAEAVQEDEAIIAGNVKLAGEMLAFENILYRVLVKTNASVDEVAAICTSSALIITDENFENALFRDNRISLKELKQRVNIPIEVIQATKS